MTQTHDTVAITGNTYPVKEQIKALGGRWNAARKCWMVPADQADAARALVAGAPAPARSFGARSVGGRRRECAECGDYFYPGKRCWETGGQCFAE